ncbi:MAG TPA: AraC family transcriptional regulator [Parafilimonas sp.]|nr:AraC family transcriptional regulator [Parafilimonas sp.]
MIQTLDILQAAHSNTIDSRISLLGMKEHYIPGSARYVMRRYEMPASWNAEDKGMLVYHFNKTNPEENFFELRFCISGNKYCSEENCGICKEMPGDTCKTHDSLDVFSFHFTSTFLYQFVHNVKLTDRKDEVLAFKHPFSFHKIFPVCSRKRMVLDALLNHGYGGATENIYTNAKVHELLLYSIECLIDEKVDGFACKFLADESGRDRIYQAREILLENIGSPITIKALSRKVAMNECYLKKGFKEIFGTTIFDFYQQQRMEHAKYLLYEKNLSVTDVSDILGYSSISHFSAAFKKHTGLKPCELLR